MSTESESGSDPPESGTLTSDSAALKQADFFIITVPTPIDDALAPDLSFVFSASKLVGGAHHFVVAHAAAGLDDAGGARINHHVQAIAKRKKRVAGNDRACQ